MVHFCKKNVYSFAPPHLDDAVDGLPDNLEKS